MPRKTKESDNKKETIKSLLLPKRKSSKSQDTKVPNDKKTNQKKSSRNKTSIKKEVEKKSNTISKSKTSRKKIEDSIKDSSVSTIDNSKKTATKKAVYSASSKKAQGAASKSVSSRYLATTKKTVTTYSPEYYDLPYKYNKTVVKLLAQTPTNLFIYWEISDVDRENLKKQYGKYFFEITKPVLVVHNQTMGYSFEVDINDFANSWYLHVNDSNCEYKIELGRRPIPINYNYIPQYDVQKEGLIKPLETPYIYISSSNNLEAPNDHILFNKQNKIYFRNVKTNKIIEKDVKDFPFINKDNTFISIYEIYKELYKEEIQNNGFDLNNPSSGNPSSGSLSSQFK